MPDRQLRLRHSNLDGIPPSCSTSTSSSKRFVTGPSSFLDSARPGSNMCSSQTCDDTRTGRRRSRVRKEAAIVHRVQRFSPGDPIVLRELWDGRVFEARPTVVVQDDPEQIALFLPPGVRCAVPVAEDGSDLRVPDRPWHFEVRPRGPQGILSFAWPGVPYAVLRWTTGDRIVWYVNLEQPLERNPVGFDTVDHALDVLVELDGSSWSWKDEDELAEAIRDGRPLVLTDAPGGSQVPDTVIEAVAGHYRRGMSNTHGAFPTSEDTDGVIAEARAAAADLTGADPDEIVVGPNATTLLFHLSRSLAKTLGPGDDVVLTRLDHDANVRPWVLAAADAGATVRWVDVRDDDVTIDEESFDAALSPRTKLVAFTLASNAVGTIPPAHNLVRRAKAVGATVALDGVHFAQHRLLDLHGVGADLLVCSPYKFFGPHLGVLAARREVLERWSPYKLVPAPDHVPERWETGTQNHEGLAGLVAAVDYVAGIAGPLDGARRKRLTASYDAIAAHERALA